MIFTTIGIRAMRAKMPHYFKTDKLVTVTRHNETIGYLIPTQALHWQSLGSNESKFAHEIAQRFNDLLALIARDKNQSAEGSVVG